MAELLLSEVRLMSAYFSFFLMFGAPVLYILAHFDADHTRTRVTSPHDPRNDRANAFIDEYRTIIHDQSSIEAIAWLKPDGPVRTTERSAHDIVRAAFDNGPGLGEEPKDVYLDGTVPLETGEESRDVQKRDWVWKESVRLTGLKEDETALVDWR